MSMNEAISDGISKRDTNPILWAIVYIALGVGGSSGLYTATSTQDRYTATDAGKDFAVRDSRLTDLVRRVDGIEARVQRIDDTHPPPELIKEIHDLGERLRELELEIARKK